MNKQGHVDVHSRTAPIPTACPQCDQPISAPACGLVHETLAAERAVVQILKVRDFLVSIDGIRRRDWKSCTRLHAFTTSERRREPITLIRSMAHGDTELFDWTEQRKTEQTERKNDGECAREVVVHVFSEGEQLAAFAIGKCLPLDYYVGPFDSASGEPLTETIVLTPVEKKGKGV